MSFDSGKTRSLVNDRLLYQIFSDGRAVERVSTYLSGVRSGKATDLRTGFFSDRPRLSVADEWKSLLKPSLPDEILEFEESQYAKIGPLSIQLPYEQRKDTILPYYTKPKSVINGQLKKRALARLLASFPRTQVLTPLSYAKAADLMQPSTNSGSPWFTKRSKVRELDLLLAKNLDLSVNDSRIVAVLGWRGQSSGTAVPKQRVVWMFPQALNIAEAAYFQPLFNLMTKFAFQVGAWIGPSEVDLRITRLMNHAESSGVNIISSDFSGYDQSLWRGGLQDFAFEVMTSLYQKEYTGLISNIFKQALSIPLLTPESLIFGDHGEPSGSNLTNMRDTLINWMVNEYVAAEFGVDLGPFSQFQGDDAVVYHQNKVPLDAILQGYEVLGLTANPEKQYYGQNVLYLQRLHTRNHKVGELFPGIYSTMRALTSLMGLERWHSGWDAKMATIRALMILENCKNHPQFEDFVKFTLEGDKLRLGLALPGGINALISKVNIDHAMSISGFVSTYNAPKLSGIADFEVVKLLQRM